MKSLFDNNMGDTQDLSSSWQTLRPATPGYSNLAPSSSASFAFSNFTPFGEAQLGSSRTSSLRDPREPPSPYNEQESWGTIEEQPDMDQVLIGVQVPEIQATLNTECLTIGDEPTQCVSSTVAQPSSDLSLEQPHGHRFKTLEKSLQAAFASDDLDEIEKTFKTGLSMVHEFRDAESASSPRTPLTGKPRWRCYLCPSFLFNSFGACKRHLFSLHGCPQYEFHCPEGCGIVEVRRDKINGHLEKIHRQQNPDSNVIDWHRRELPVPPVCNGCSKTVQSWEEFWTCVEDHARFSLVYLNDAEVSRGKAGRHRGPSRQTPRRLPQRCAPRSSKPERQKKNPKHHKPVPKPKPPRCNSCRHEFRECSDCAAKTQSTTSCHMCSNQSAHGPSRGASINMTHDTSDLRHPSNNFPLNLQGSPNFEFDFGPAIQQEHMTSNYFFSYPNLNPFEALPARGWDNDLSLMRYGSETDFQPWDNPQNPRVQLAAVSPVNVPLPNPFDIKISPKLGSKELLLPGLNKLIEPADARARLDEIPVESLVDPIPGTWNHIIPKIETSLATAPESGTTWQCQCPCRPKRRAQYSAHTRTQISPGKRLEIMFKTDRGDQAPRGVSHALRTQVQVVVKLLKLRSSVSKSSEPRKRNEESTESATLALQPSQNSAMAEMNSPSTEPQEVIETLMVIDCDLQRLIQELLHLVNGAADTTSSKLIPREADVDPQLAFLVFIHVILFFLSMTSHESGLLVED